MHKLKVAALDLGSNTFLCLIAELELLNGHWKFTKVISDQVEIVRLGQDLEKTKKFHPEALVRAENTIKKFSETIELHKPDRILAMATSAARDAENKNLLFEMMARYKIPMEIITGRKETSITYAGAISNYNSNHKNADSQILVIDIGGGSTEFIFGSEVEYFAGVSLDIGCVRITERFITSYPVGIEELKNTEDFIAKKIIETLAQQPQNFKVDTILAVAGTPTALAAAEIGAFTVEKIDGYVLTLQQLEKWKLKMSQATLLEIVAMGIPSGRADVILVGVITLIETLRVFSLSQIVVSTRGVRFGVALELCSRN